MRPLPHPVASGVSAAVLLLCSALSSAAAPVISEIMYRPGAAFPENTALEYIEVYNPDAAPVDVSGWAFRSGVSYTFPAGTTLAAGGYRVVAASPSALQAVYGSLSALGPWLAGDTLSNNSEKITLSKPAATPGTWTKVDEVTYASEGDWAQRVREATFSGWDWSTPANGGGKSMELRNAALSNDNGQNWAPSTAANGGTPGAANTVATANVPPVIQNVKHSPAVPASTQSVTISCDVYDEALPAALTATLFYRNATTATPPAFSSVALTNDGTGKFKAILPPAADKTIIEFYVSSNDGTATRTWPAPTSEGQNANCQYQVDNEALSTTADTYRLTMTAAENNAFTTVSQSSDRQFNQTLIVVRGTETSIRYRSAMRIRGNSSRSYQFKPLRISLPNDDAFDGYTTFNLNPKASFLQYLGMKCFHAAGLVASNAIPVELRRNGVEQTTGGGNTPDFGLWVRVEDLGTEMVGKHWPLANSGGIYKKGRPDQYWRSLGTAPGTPAGTLDGWTKQNNSGANDWSDLTGFFALAQTVSAPHFPGSAAGNSAGAGGGTLSGTGNWNFTPYSDDEVELLGTRADTNQWARWFAMMTLLQDNETNISNGEDDDYACYFYPDVSGQRRMQLVPHDLDTILGMGDTTNGRGLYDATEEGSTFRPLLPLMGNTATAGNASWRAGYHANIRLLCGTVFNPATFPAFVEYHLGNWVPPATRSSITTFMSNRCTSLMGTIGAGAITPAPATASTSTALAHGALVISEVLAANATAHLHDGVYPDVIELSNASAAPLDLGGKSLTDDPALTQKFVFPAGLTLGPGAFLVLYADANFAGTGYHTGFSLDQGGDGVYLYDTPANGAALLDAIVFGPQATDYSVGRTGANLTTLTLCTPTINAANTAVAALGSPAALRINECFANPDFRLDDDFVEIYNPGTLPAAMGGMKLTDDPISYPSRHVLPVLSFIGPGGFHVFKAKGKNAAPGNPAELPFSFDSTFGQIALIGVNGSIADSVDTVSQFRDQSTGRTPDGGVTLSTFAVPSPGLPNAPLPAAYQLLLNNLRISEFIYKPNGGSDYEFIELLNTGSTALDLSGVRFTNGVDYTFPAGTSLTAGAFTVVCRSRTALIGRFPNVTPVLAPGEFTGSLDNNGESITLSLPNPWDIAILNFRYETTWEPLTASAGYSLTHVDAINLPARDYNQRDSWTASTVVNGTPGSDGPPGINSALAAPGLIGSAFSYQITANRGPTAYAATGLPAGLTCNTATGLLSGTPAVSGVFNVSITAANTAGTDTKVLVLTIASSGPLHHFTWEYTTPSASAGVPFPAYVTARDLQNRLVTSFSGNVPLTATASGGGASISSVYITEVTDEAEDQFELQNTGSGTVNTAGWFVVVSNSSAIDSVNPVTWSLPASVAPGEMLRVSELSGQQGRAYFGGGISWTVALNRGWIMLFDAGGALRDFMAWGWPSADLAGLTITVNSAPVTLAGSWTGAGAAIGTRGASNSWQRIGSADTNTAANWVFAADTTSWGVTNAGLSIPWQTAASVTVSPSSLTFAGGVFAGFLTVNETATGVRLTSADAQSHTGQSALFDVTPAPLDSDGDKMPDAWETANGLSSSVNDAAADSDGDGFSNLTEYRAGTDPRSGASSLKISGLTVSPAAQVSLSWPTQANRLYRISSSAALTAWSLVPGQIYIPSAAGTSTAVFPLPAGFQTRGFFRVELLLPP